MSEIVPYPEQSEDELLNFIVVAIRKQKIKPYKVIEAIGEELKTESAEMQGMGAMGIKIHHKPLSVFSSRKTVTRFANTYGACGEELIKLANKFHMEIKATSQHQSS